MESSNVSLARLVKQRRGILVTMIALAVVTYYIKYIPHFKFAMVGGKGSISPMTILLPVNGLVLGPIFGVAASILGIGLHLVLEPETGIFGPFSIIPNILATFTAGMLSRGHWKPAALVFLVLSAIWYMLPAGRVAWNWPYLHLATFGVAIILGSRMRSMLGSFRWKMVLGLFIATLASLLVDSLSGSILAILYLRIPVSIFYQIIFIYPLERISMAIAATLFSGTFTYILLAANAPLPYVLPSESYPEAFDELWKDSAAKSREKGIPRDIILDAIRLSYDCALKEEEGRPTSTGLIVGDAEKILKVLPGTGCIAFPKQDMRESHDYLGTLFGVVDGISSAFVINKAGSLREVGLLWPSPKAEFGSSALIAQRYRPYAYITKTVGDSLAFFSFGRLRVVKLFEGGSLKAEASFSWKKGKWVFRPFPRALEELGVLATDKGIDFDVLCKCFSIAVEMSNRRLGGSFIIGDHETVLNQSQEPLFRLENAKLLDFDGEKEEYIINLASKEFATILDASGGIAASSTRLLAQPPTGISVEVTSEDGGRHRSAAEMTAAASKSVAMVISEDGPITIYSKGKRIIRI